MSMICLKRWQARGGFRGLLKDRHCGHGNTSASPFTSCPQHNSSGIQKSPQRFNSHCSDLPSQIPVLGEQGIQMTSSCDAQMQQNPLSLSLALPDSGWEVEKCQKAVSNSTLPHFSQLFASNSWKPLMAERSILVSKSNPHREATESPEKGHIWVWYRALGALGNISVIGGLGRDRCRVQLNFPTRNPSGQVLPQVWNLENTCLIHIPFEWPARSGSKAYLSPRFYFSPRKRS